MFVKNDSSAEKAFYNGKIGQITAIAGDKIFVNCPGDEEVIEVKPERWDNTRYKIDDETKEIQEEVEGTFTQYPLKTAWAITIHKSQGLTFEKAIIDANAAFAHGQVYVALSRCKSLEGLVLTSPLNVSALKTDAEVSGFIRKVEEEPVGDDALMQAKRDYRFMLLQEMFDMGSLERQLAYCLRVAYENKGAVQDELPVTLGNMKTMLTSEMKPVADKFLGQINRLLQENPDTDNNDFLQERIQKASNWFSDKTAESLKAPFENLNLETDNKTVRKTLKQAFERLGLEIGIKSEVYEQCKEGFEVKKYLKARAQGVLDGVSVPSTGRSRKAVDVSVKYPDLYSRLKQWRDDKAEELDQEVYMVLQIKSMKHIAATLPQSMKEMKKIHGFGKVKLEKYGPEVLQIVLDYCKEHDLERTDGEENPFEMPSSKPKKEKVDTKQVTFDLFKKGKTIEAIAQERSLTAGTIFTHIGHFVRSGEINIFQIIPAEKVHRVADWLDGNKAESLTEVKNHFGDEVSWDELRLIVNHVKAKEEVKGEG